MEKVPGGSDSRKGRAHVRLLQSKARCEDPLQKGGQDPAGKQKKGRVKASRFHQWAAFQWAALAIPTVLWWKDSILWVALMSLYANVVGHWSAYQAAKAEEEAKRVEKEVEKR